MKPALSPALTPVLYAFRRCPYAMRARLALQASGQRVELREIVLKDKPAALLAASPKATVPVLVLTDRVLEQSLDVMLWALQQSDPLGWLPAEPDAMQDALGCIARNDGSFKHHLDRYKYPHRYGLKDGLAHREQGAEFLWQLDARLQRAPHVASALVQSLPQQASREASSAIHINPSATAVFTLSPSQWGFLDAALAPFVRQFAHTDRGWFDAQDWHALSQWLKNFEASAALAAILEKVPPWKPGDAPLYC